MTRLAVLAFGLLSPVLCSAQDAQTLSLEQSLKLAFEHNPDIVAAQLNQQRAEIDERSSFGRFLPSCNSRLNCALQDKPQTSLSGIQGLIRTRESCSFGLCASWVLFSSFGGLAAHAGQRHVTEACKLIHQRTNEEVAFSVTQQYLACVRASQLVGNTRGVRIARNPRPLKRQGRAFRAFRVFCRRYAGGGRHQCPSPSPLFLLVDLASIERPFS